MFDGKGEQELIDIAYIQFSKLERRYNKNQDKSLITSIGKIKEDVNLKLNDHASGVKRFTHALDEEQEKELEQETEEHIQTERPPEAKPAEPKYDKRLKHIVRDGIGKIKIRLNIIV